jgi:hypothetical protein
MPGMPIGQVKRASVAGDAPRFASPFSNVRRFVAEPIMPQ